MGKLFEPAHAVRFGLFQVDLQSGELHKNGLKIRLQDQPFQVLSLLLERPGEIVTREDLRQKLWLQDTFVDFDHGLNAAINKLRETLGDSAERPRYVETIPKRGYRFIAPVRPVTNGQPETPAKPEGAHARLEEEIRRRREKIAFMAALVVAAGAIFAAWLSRPMARAAPELRVRKFAFAPQEEPGMAAISPDGHHIAYVAGEGGQKGLWIQDLDREDPRSIAHSDGAEWPFWSPDSASVAFAAGGELRRAGPQTGDLAAVCRLPQDEFLGGGWSPDDESIVFSILHQGIYEVPARGGVPRLIVKVDRGPGKGDHFDDPSFLPMPDGSRVLLYASQILPVGHEIVVHSLKTGRRKALVAQGGYPDYSPTGHILFVSKPGWHLQAVPFSLATLAVAGEPFEVAGRGARPSVARDGTLVYVDYAKCLAPYQLTWLGRSGIKAGTVGRIQRDIGSLSISPDGRTVATRAWEPGGPNIWLHDVSRGTTTRLTLADADERPIWSADGKDITFASQRRGSVEIFSMPADGSGEPRTLVATPLTERVCDWSPDGRFLAYQVYDPKNRSDLWYLKQKENGSYESVSFLRTPFREALAVFSPDGLFLAYVSDESGRDEVYVRRFPDGSAKRQVSVNGGGQPRWRGDGKEMFYVENETLMAVPLTTEPDFSLGPAKRLFQNENLAQGSLQGEPPRTYTYTVSRDGQRFLVAEKVGDPSKPVIRVVENWFAEFQKH